MLIQLKPGLLRAVATDGHRLAMSDAQVPTIQETKQVIVPRKGITELARLLSDIDGEVSVTVSGRHIRVQLKDLSFTSHLVDATFPDSQRGVRSATPRT